MSLEDVPRVEDQHQAVRDRLPIGPIPGDDDVPQGGWDMAKVMSERVAKS